MISLVYLSYKSANVDLDRGFAAYISYLHMEATYTNPIMLGKNEYLKICLKIVSFQHSVILFLMTL